MEFIIKKNELYKTKSPRFSIITTFYNRRKTLLIPLESAKKQNSDLFEHVIVDNGSSENNDDIIEKYMKEVEYPVIYIKKPYDGGALRGRMVGADYSRGKYFLYLDSDDELVDDAIVFLDNIWRRLEKQKDYEEYDQVIGPVILTDGRKIGAFCDSLNFVSDTRLLWKKARMINNNEWFGSIKTNSLKKCIIPNPSGVYYAKEQTIWGQLEKKRAYFFDVPLRIYHTETEDSLAHKGVVNVQSYVDNLWYNKFLLMHWEYYSLSLFDYYKILFLYHKNNIIVKYAKKNPEALDWFCLKKKVKNWYDDLICFPVALVISFSLIIIKRIYLLKEK